MLNTRGPRLYSVLEVNPDALEIADQLDREFGESGVRRPLHGIPLLLKDNIDTADGMTTTAGSTALRGSIAPQDSTVAARLRDAGGLAARQGQHERVGRLEVVRVRDPGLEWSWMGRRTRGVLPKPLCARPRPRGFELGVRRLGRCQPRRGDDRLGDRWIDRGSLLPKLPGRGEADDRAPQPRRGDPDRAQPGQHGAHGTYRSGRRDPAGYHGRHRPAGSPHRCERGQHFKIFSIWGIGFITIYY